jgi:hypothetical protein
LGDLDVWSFNANAGDSLMLRMGATDLNPAIRLYGRTALAGESLTKVHARICPDALGH